MANGGDERPVLYGRWQAEHAALRELVEAQLADMRADIAALQQVNAERRGHLWMLTLAFVTGLVLPLAVVAVVAVATALGH